MKTLIIYTSVHHGNTEKVAGVMASILNARLLQVKQATASMLDKYDLIGFGSGIYFGRHHKQTIILSVFSLTGGTRSVQGPQGLLDP